MSNQNPPKRTGHERPVLYEDDLTEERDPSPVEVEEAAHKVVLDPERDSDEPG
jgi:hypothetical protein